MNPEQYRLFREFAPRLQKMERELWADTVRDEFGDDPEMVAAVLEMLPHLSFEADSPPTVKISGERERAGDAARDDLRFYPLGARMSRRASMLAAVALLVLMALSVGALVKMARSTRFPFDITMVDGPPTFRYVAARLRDDPNCDIRVGDVVAAVNGYEVRDGQIARIRLRSGPPGSTVDLTIKRGEETFDCRVRSSPRTLQMFPALYMRSVFVFLCWGIIAFAFIRNPRDPTVILTGLAGGIPIAAISIDMPSLGYGPALVHLLWEAAFTITVGLEGVVFLHWTFRFPNRRTLTRRMLFCMYVVPVVLLLVTVALIPVFFLRNNLDPLYRLFRMQAAVDVVFVLLAFGNLIKTYFSALDHNRRLQVRWIITCLIVGVTPEAALVFFDHVLRVPHPFPLILIDVGFLVVAAGFLFSIARFRLFDLELILGYGGLLLGVGTISLLLYQVAIAFGLGDYGREPEVVRAASFAAGLMLAVVFRRPIQRLIGAVRFSPPGLLEKCDAVLAHGEPTVPAVDEMLSVACDQLRVDRMALYLTSEADGRFVCAGSAGFTWQDVASFTLSRSDALPSLLANRRAPLRTETYAKSVLALLPDAEIEMLQKLNAAVVAGILRRDRLVGFLTCSAHRTGALPDSKVCGFLGKLAGVLADHTSGWAPPAPAAADLARGSVRETSCTANAPTAPQSIGPYEIIRRIGAGGSGVVYEAHHRSERRNVALKMLHRDQVPRGINFRNFLTEIEALARIYDPHVVQVLDFGNCEGVPWFAMELIGGATLRNHLRDLGTLTQPATAKIGADVARGLAACHAAGVVHRDITPANIVYSGERARIIDLGLARELQPAHQSPSTANIVGSIAGTASYMSPEQATGRPLTGASDLFSLGVVLYECLVGQPPFRGRTVGDTIRNIKMGRYTPLDRCRPDTSEPFVRLVSRLLETEPESRFSSSAEVAKQLDRLSEFEAQAERSA